MLTSPFLLISMAITRFQLTGKASSNCSAVNQTISTNNLLPHGRALSWRSRETFMLCSNDNYTIRVSSHDTGKNLSIDIDSLILLPQLTELHAYKNSSTLVDTCLRNYTTIQGSYASTINCRSVTFSTMVELFNGSLGKIFFSRFISRTQSSLYRLRIGGGGNCGAGSLRRLITHHAAPITS